MDKNLVFKSKVIYVSPLPETDELDEIIEATSPTRVRTRRPLLSRSSAGKSEGFDSGEYFKSKELWEEYQKKLEEEGRDSKELLSSEGHPYKRSDDVSTLGESPKRLSPRQEPLELLHQACVAANNSQNDHFHATSQSSKHITSNLLHPDSRTASTVVYSHRKEHHSDDTFPELLRKDVSDISKNSNLYKSKSFLS